MAIRREETISLPALFSSDPGTARRVLEFFTINIRIPHKAAGEFATLCEACGITHLRDVQPAHVAAYVEELQQRIAAPSIKLQLAGIRMLFDWLVVGQVMPMNPASAVRGPKHSVKKGKTPVLAADEARALLDAIDTSTIVGLRDRALIALMTFTFARVGASAGKMHVEDVYVQGRRTWVRLHEKGGKRHEMPCHHKLAANLHAYIEALHAAAKIHGAAVDPKAWLFSTTEGQLGALTGRPMSQPDVYRMIGRRAVDAGIQTKISCRTFRATGITEYCATAASSKSRSRWRTTRAPGSPAFTTAATTRSTSMKWRGF